MSQVVVGIADCRLSDSTDDTIVTHALGSCIAVTIHDPITKVGGMLHLMLPDSTLDREKAQRNPYMFADTGIPILFRSAYTKGAEKRRLTVYLAGGAQVMDEQGIFNIGKRNYLAARKILWKAGVLISAEAVGGNQSRTVRLDVGTGAFWLRDGGRTEQLVPSTSPKSAAPPDSSEAAPPSRTPRPSLALSALRSDSGATMMPSGSRLEPAVAVREPLPKFDPTATAPPLPRANGLMPRN